MKSILKTIASPISIILILSFFFNLGTWLYTFLNYKASTDDIIPLHYTIYFGIDLVDYKIKLFTYPALGLSILIINCLLVSFLKKEKLLVYFLTGGALFTEVLILLTEVSLIVNYY